MKLTNQIKELIKIDIKNGMSIANLTKKYEVKKNVIRNIQAEINGGQSLPQGVAPTVSQVVAPNVSEIITEVTVTKDEPTKEVATINNYLSDNFEILIEMIERYKKEHPVYQGDIVIKLPKEDSGDYKVSLRINKFVMQDFREFCRENKEFTQKELLSMALIEYMEKYKKK